MKKCFKLAALLVIVIPSFLLGQTRLHSLSFYSQDVHDTMHVVILLPTSYDHARAYPVLYLLHGYDGSQVDWTERTDLVDYTAHLPVIIVMPEAKNSWYVNCETDPNARYEDYIIDELPKFVNAIYPLDTTRAAIAGLSMGGYGALVLALLHPGMFIFAGDLSGAITIPGVIDSVLAHPGEPVPGNQGAIYPSIVKAFGDSNKVFRDDHNVFVLLRREHSEKLPYIFCAAGIQDGFTDFLPADRRFTGMLREYGKPYEYHEMPGVHNWHFWDMEIQPLLERMAVVMKLK